MPRERLIKKIGCVAIVRNTDSGRLFCRWWSPGRPGQRGRYVWQSVRSKDLKVAERQAMYLDTLARSRRGLVPLTEERRPILLQDVIALDLAAWDVDARQRRRYRDEGVRFFQFLIQQRKAGQVIPVEDFSVSDLTTALLRQYIAWCQRRGLSHDSIRHALYVLRRAAAYAEQWGIPNRIKDLKHRRETPVKIRWVGLSVIADWIEGFASDRPDLAAIAALAGFAGLRILEATHLRLCDYDREARTVEITATEAKRPKTLSSFRVIPICRLATDRLDAWLSISQPASQTAPIFPTKRQNVWTVGGISHALRVLIRKANLDITPKDLRKSFATHCESTLAIPKPALDRYMGHGSSIRAVHYTARVVEDLRRDVVKPLERNLRDVKPSIQTQDFASISYKNKSHTR